MREAQGFCTWSKITSSVLQPAAPFPVESMSSTATYGRKLIECGAQPSSLVSFIYLDDCIYFCHGGIQFHWEKKVYQHDSYDSSQFLPKAVCKKINMQLPCQTVGRNSFSLPRALWQVHCGRSDSCTGGKWIVITCLFLMTLGWVPSDLLLEFWIGLLPSLRQAAEPTRLAGGRH